MAMSSFTKFAFFENRGIFGSQIYYAQIGWSGGFYSFYDFENAFKNCILR